MNTPPDSLDDIVAHCLGHADEQVAARIEAAARLDPASRNRLDAVRAMLRSLQEDDGRDPSPECLRRAQALMEPRHAAHRPKPIRTSLARLIFDSFAAPATPGLRGASRVRHVVYDGDLGEIDLRIESAPGAPIRLLGQIDPLRAPDARVTIVQPAPEPPAVASLDAHGVFAVTIPHGPFTLRVESGGRSMTTPELGA